MSFVQKKNNLYGFESPLTPSVDVPIISQRAPTTTDYASLGREWIDVPTNAVYFLTSIVSNVATWVSVSGAAGVFTSLTVNPGPTNLSTVGNGAVNIGNAANTQAITINSGPGGIAIDGNGHVIGIGNDAAANAVVIGSNTAGASTTIQGGNGTGLGVAAIELVPAVTGDIQIGATNGTGTIYVGPSTAAETINIGTAVSGAKSITVGNLAAGTLVTIRGDATGATADAIFLNSGGYVAVVPNLNASGSATPTVQGRVFQLSATGFTTAAAASQVITITNALAAVGSPVFVTVANDGSNDAQMTLQRVQTGVGTIAITMKNNGAAALNGNIYITVWLID